MNKLTKIGLGLGAVGFAGVALAQGLAVVTTLSATDIIPLASGTVSTGIAASDLATFVKASGTGPVVTSSVSNSGTSTLLIGGATTTLAGLQVAQPASRVNDITITPGATTVVPIIAAGGAGADANIGLAIDANGTGSVYLNGTTAANAAASVAAGTANVNQIILTGTNTGTTPTITSGGTGADANISLQLNAAGTGQVNIGGTTTTGGLQVAQTASAVNNVVITNGATGTAPTIVTGGATVDANRNLALKGNGTGIVTLGGTGGANGLSCSDSGNGARTCNGQRGIATFTATTIAAATNSAQTINNTSVTANSLLMCELQSFTGTIVTNGIPVVTTCVAGSGTITVNITNVHASNSTGSQSFGVGFVVLN